MHPPGIARLLALAALLSAAPALSASTLEAQRADYLAAMQAVRAGDTARARHLSARLKDYVLHGYLEYELLKDRLASAPDAELHAFLERNGHAPFADVVRRQWLRALAARGAWDRFLAEYRPVEDESAGAARGAEALGDPELACLRLNQLLRRGEATPAVLAEIDLLWRSPRRWPAACDALFAAWHKAGHLPPEKVWARAQLAMDQRQATLVSELGRYLEPKDRVWVTRWLAMHRQPLEELDGLRYPVDTPVARMIVRHGVVRLAERDAEQAMRRWEGLKQRYLFFGEDDSYVARNVGIRAAQDNRPGALRWLAAVSADPEDELLHLWRVRAALRAGDWDMARTFVAALSEAQQTSAQWRYWRARILERTGESKEAERLFAALARERGYYGFLAADRLGLDYSMQHVSIEVDNEELAALLARPGIRMAQELYQLGLLPEARRQWSYTLRHLSKRELQVAAVVARDWGWYDRAILTVARSDHRDDLELRFPVLYRDMIESNASAAGIDPGWIYGVVRQESAFVVDARSPVGALGLMQLMPATGRFTGRKLKIDVGSNRALLDVGNNLRLGTSYLKEMLDRHRGNQVLATAAYNAGPNRVAGWLPPAGRVEAPLWVEAIPFNETRDYVKNVLAYSAVYDHRLGSRPTRLSSRMLPVSAARADAP